MQSLIKVCNFRKILLEYGATNVPLEWKLRSLLSSIIFFYVDSRGWGACVIFWQGMLGKLAMTSVV